jgi:hypothetical protein
MSQGFSSQKFGAVATNVFVNGILTASTSGSTIDFVVPSGIKRFTICYDATSLTSTDDLTIQLGDAGGIEATGYYSTSSYHGGVNQTVGVNSTVHFNAVQNTSGSSPFHGLINFVLMDEATNLWAASGCVASGIFTYSMGGSKALSGELTTVQLGTASSATYDAGNVSIQYDNQNLAGVTASGTGRVVQVVNVQDGEFATSSTTIPDDDTIPQITEGAEIVVSACMGSGAVENVTTALFQDSTADALACVRHRHDTTNVTTNTYLSYWMTAGTASSTTFSVRAGAYNSHTLTFNGMAGARKHGGAINSSITITEYQV